MLLKPDKPYVSNHLGLRDWGLGYLNLITPETRLKAPAPP